MSKALIIITLLFTTLSCSVVTNKCINRFPSSIDQLSFNIKKYTNKDFNLFSTHHALSSNSPEVIFEMVESTEMPADVAYQINKNFRIRDDKILIKIFHSSDYKNFPTSKFLLNTILKFAFFQETSDIPINNLEIFYNAINGDRESIMEIYKNLEKELIQNIDEINLAYPIKQKSELVNISIDNFKSLITLIKSEKKNLNQMNDAKTAQNIDQMSSIKITRLALLEKLDSNTEQLNALVIKNDRKKVADLIESYLPIGEMKPFELRYWKHTLNIMRNPVPIEDRVLLIRGLQKGRLHYGATINGENSPFLFAAFIEENKGSFNNRLRILKKIRDSVTQNKFYKIAPISNIMSGHSTEHLKFGSYYNSFTTDFSTAEHFARTGDIAFFAFDPRIAVPNGNSRLNETEMLIPIVTFPDEYLYHYDNKSIPHDTFSPELWNEIEIATSKKYGKTKANKMIYNYKRKFMPYLNIETIRRMSWSILIKEYMTNYKNSNSNKNCKSAAMPFL